jgi:hypothetical protein
MGSVNDKIIMIEWVKYTNNLRGMDPSGTT